MFAVYRSSGDGCTCSYDILLFVTESKQKAEESVILARLELEEACKIPLPTCRFAEIRHNPKNAEKYISDYKIASKQYEIDKKAYEEKVKSILTVDPENYNFDRYNDGYWFSEVKVR